MTTPRTCIKCNESLELQNVLGVEIDCCKGCGGIWLDENEIKQLAENPEKAIEATDKLMPRRKSDTRPPDVIDVPCPACAGKLTVATFGPTRIEHCNACRGIFLDRGELEKAMALVGSKKATTIVALARSVYTCGGIDAR